MIHFDHIKLSAPWSVECACCGCSNRASVVVAGAAVAVAVVVAVRAVTVGAVRVAGAICATAKVPKPFKVQIIDMSLGVSGHSLEHNP